MLHTLNKAWAACLAHQIRTGMISTVLIIANTPEEYECKKCLWDARWDNNRVETQVVCMSIDRIRYITSNKVHLPIFDDILISHDLHDIMVKDYLSKHCRRLIRGI